jgi:hypothetical protein
LDLASHAGGVPAVDAEADDPAVLRISGRLAPR